jgi:hypothetical protein
MSWSPGGFKGVVTTAGFPGDKAFGENTAHVAAPTHKHVGRCWLVRAARAAGNLNRA